MPAYRYFLDSPADFLTGDEFYHLKSVMRARIGDTIELVNGKGTLSHARLTNISKDAAHFEITSTTHTPPPAPLILAQALTRPALLDWIIEKGTELGATGFWLFPGELSEKKELSLQQIKRLQTLIISALKQCGTLYLPTLELKPPLSLWEKPDCTLLYGSLAPTARPLTQHSPAIIAIGPEKGFSPQEHTALDKLGSIGVSLHRNILRAETAALCALSLLSRS